MIPLPLIRTALDASEAAYSSAWGLRIEDPTNSATATIDRVGDYTVLAYKGSAELTDWLINATAMPRPYAGAWVHWGFACAHRSIWPEVRNELVRLGNRPLIVTGHSLGGALAELTMLMLGDYPAPVHLVTFGKPNVFAKPRKARFPWLAQQISVVNGSDMVARIPRAFFGPDLGQSMLYLAQDRNHWFEAMTPEAQAIIAVDRKHTLITDHLLPGYRARIERGST